MFDEYLLGFSEHAQGVSSGGPAKQLAIVFFSDG